MYCVNNMELLNSPNSIQSILDIFDVVEKLHQPNKNGNIFIVRTWNWNLPRIHSVFYEGNTPTTTS